MVKITKTQAVSLVPGLRNYLAQQPKIIGEVGITRNGCKVCRKRNGHFQIFGYAWDGSDLMRDMASMPA